MYQPDIPFKKMGLEKSMGVSLIKQKMVNFEFIEEDYTRYIKVFQRRWREWHRIRKQAFRYLRLRELGLARGHLG